MKHRRAPPQHRTKENTSDTSCSKCIVQRWCDGALDGVDCSRALAAHRLSIGDADMSRTGTAETGGWADNEFWGCKVVRELPGVGFTVGTSGDTQGVKPLFCLGFRTSDAENAVPSGMLVQLHGDGPLASVNPLLGRSRWHQAACEAGAMGRTNVVRASCSHLAAQSCGTRTPAPQHAPIVDRLPSSERDT